MSITVVIPSRGRPERAKVAIAAALGLAVRADTSIVLAVDADDPTLDAYRSLYWPGPLSPVLIVLDTDTTGNLVRATNTISMRIATEDPGSIIGNLGDDHIVRTLGWDRLVTEALQTPGIAYGDDLIHGAALPTAPFISAPLALALGWYALPSCSHVFIDTAWKDIGEATGTLRFLPDLVIEHMHPLVDKGDWDDGYRTANSVEAMARDRAAYEAWRDGPASEDIARCLAIL